MTEAASLAQQVRTNFSKVESSAKFDDQIWLTFYLAGAPANLRQVAESLNARGWVNLDGSEGAFLYPKVQVERSLEEVVRTAEAAHKLCAAQGVEILNIDADTSPELERSHFLTLYRL